MSESTDTTESRQASLVCLEACLAREVSVNILRVQFGDELLALLTTFVDAMPRHYGIHTRTLAVDARYLGLAARRLLTDTAPDPAEPAPPGCCTARPWISCSRPDGQPLRHWDGSSWWVNDGDACDAREREAAGS